MRPQQSDINPRVTLRQEKERERERFHDPLLIFPSYTQENKCPSTAKKNDYSVSLMSLKIYTHYKFHQYSLTCTQKNLFSLQKDF